MTGHKKPCAALFTITSSKREIKKAEVRICCYRVKVSGVFYLSRPRVVSFLEALN